MNDVVTMIHVVNDNATAGDPASPGEYPVLPHGSANWVRTRWRHRPGDGDSRRAERVGVVQRPGNRIEYVHLWSPVDTRCRGHRRIRGGQCGRGHVPAG
ncbi:MAG: hypothetical protein J07HX64_03041 [halophilic archaeon J07HX64]|nr:MAG: hypothetical protein J07HX64_03041 [halophilic archaeon J07HX64]